MNVTINHTANDKRHTIRIWVGTYLIAAIRVVVCVEDPYGSDFDVWHWSVTKGAMGVHNLISHGTIETVYAEHPRGVADAILSASLPTIRDADPELDLSSVECLQTGFRFGETDR